MNELVNFPFDNDDIIALDEGITYVYLLTIDPEDSERFENSNTHLFQQGIFVGDNSSSNSIDMKNLSIDDIVSNEIRYLNIDSNYFPYYNDETVSYEDINKYLSVPLVNCVLLGKTKHTFEHNKIVGHWAARYDDLNDEGKTIWEILSNELLENKIITLVKN